MEEPRKRKIDKNRWELDKVRFGLDKPLAPHREIQPINKILEQILEGLKQPESEDILMLRNAWTELVGVQIAKYSSPGFIKDWTLYIRVNHPGWLPEMKYNHSIILSKLQTHYPSLPIRRLNFILS